MNNSNIKKVSSAAGNMCSLIDDIVKKARRNFKESGKADIDAKFLKESVSALKELCDLIEEYDGTSQGDSQGLIIRFEKQIEEWSK